MLAFENVNNLWRRYGVRAIIKRQCQTRSLCAIDFAFYWLKRRVRLLRNNWLRNISMRLSGLQDSMR